MNPNPSDAEWSSRRVRADRDVNNAFELFSAVLDGSQPALRLNPALARGADVAGSASARCDARGLYERAARGIQRWQDMFGVDELYAVVPARYKHPAQRP